MVALSDGSLSAFNRCFDSFEQWFRHGSFYLYAFLVSSIFHFKRMLQVILNLNITWLKS